MRQWLCLSMIATSEAQRVYLALRGVPECVIFSGPSSCFCSRCRENRNRKTTGSVTLCVFCRRGGDCVRRHDGVFRRLQHCDQQHSIHSELRWTYCRRCAWCCSFSNIRFVWRVWRNISPFFIYTFSFVHGACFFKAWLPSQLRFFTCPPQFAVIFSQVDELNYNLLPWNILLKTSGMHVFLSCNKSAHLWHSVYLTLLAEGNETTLPVETHACPWRIEGYKSRRKFSVMLARNILKMI